MHWLTSCMRAYRSYELEQQCKDGAACCAELSAELSSCRQAAVADRETAAARSAVAQVCMRFSISVCGRLDSHHLLLPMTQAEMDSVKAQLNSAQSACAELND